jgi:uncharacterized protein YejL (UPF0352 family)
MLSSADVRQVLEEKTTESESAYRALVALGNIVSNLFLDVPALSG